MSQRRVVIGAGLTGAATACQLACAGHHAAHAAHLVGSPDRAPNHELRETPDGRRLASDCPDQFRA